MNSRQGFITKLRAATALHAEFNNPAPLTGPTAKRGHMSCKYIILKNTLTDVYYPVAISDGSALSTKALTKLITKRCTVTRSDALAVITAMVEVINETLADFDFQKQLTAVRVQLTPDREKNSNGSYERELVDSTDMEWSLDASSPYTPSASSSTTTTNEDSDSEAETGEASATNETSSESANSEEADAE